MCFIHLSIDSSIRIIINDVILTFEYFCHISFYYVNSFFFFIYLYMHARWRKWEKIHNHDVEKADDIHIDIE